MQNSEAAEEPGVYYLVPNSTGTGKKVIRRPQTPLTSSPLDDDFDAITQGATTTHGGAPPTSVDPMRDDFDLETRPTTFVGDGHGRGRDAYEEQRMYATPTSDPPDRMLPKHYRQHSDSALPRMHSDRQVRRRQQDVLDDYNDYDQYVDETDRVFRGGGADEDVDLEKEWRRQMLLRQGSREEESSAAVTTAAGEVAVAARTVHRIRSLRSPVPRESPSLNPSPNNHDGTRRYELVGRKVLEDSPEKTVTVAAWREQVARAVGLGDDEGTVSVYYVTADDYALENGRGARREFDAYKSLGSEVIARPMKEVQTKEGGVWEGRRFAPENSSSFRYGQTRPVLTPRPARPRRNTPPQRLDRHGSGSNSPSLQQPPTGSRSSPRAPPTPPRSNTPRSSSQREKDTSLSPHSIPKRPPNPTPGTSTPRRPSPRARSPRTHARVPPGRSSSPFHATHSTGATISTIVGVGPLRAEADGGIDDILDSCEPSLLHIKDALRQLGISREEHLMAVIKLREETRDREVREEALKKGITVVEWAILVDRLLGLSL